MSSLTDYIPAGHTVRLYRGRLVVNPRAGVEDWVLAAELQREGRPYTTTSGLGLVAWRLSDGTLKIASDLTMAQVELILAAALAGA